MIKINFDSRYTFYTLIDKKNPMINGLILPSVGDMTLGFVQRTLANSLFSRIFDSFSDLISLLDISGNHDSYLMEKILVEDYDSFDHIEDIIKTNADQKDFLNSIFSFHFQLSDFIHFYLCSYVSIVDNEGYQLLDDSPISLYVKEKMNIHYEKLDKILYFNSFVKNVLQSLKEVKND